MLSVGLSEPLACGRVLALNIGLELGGLDAPLVASAHLNRGQVAISHKRIGLDLRDVERLLHVGKSEESLGHAPILARTH